MSDIVFYGGLADGTRGTTDFDSMIIQIPRVRMEDVFEHWGKPAAELPQGTIRSERYIFLKMDEAHRRIYMHESIYKNLEKQHDRP